jgi:hypothetical protein
MQVPFDVVGDFRGLQRHGGEFTNRDGEKITYGDTVGFEVELPDDTFEVWPVKFAQLAEAAVDLDVGKLKRGDLVRLVGAGVIRADGGYVKIVEARRASARPVAAAA